MACFICRKPRKPPQMPLGNWEYSEIKEWLSFLGARNLRGAFKRESGQSLAKMKAEDIQRLVGNRCNQESARMLVDSIQEILKEQNISESPHTPELSPTPPVMSSSASNDGNISSPPIEECLTPDTSQPEDEIRALQPKIIQIQSPQTLESGAPSQAPTLLEGLKENHSGITERPFESPRSRGFRSPQKPSTFDFEDDFESESEEEPSEIPGALEAAFATFAAQGAVVGTRKRNETSQVVQMSGSSFWLMWTTCNLADNGMRTHSDVLFNQVKHQREKRTIGFHEFEKALEFIAKKKEIPLQEIRNRIIAASHHVRSHRPASSQGMVTPR